MHRAPRSTAFALALVAAALARAEIIVQTDDPFCEGICPGIYGFDVANYQSVGIRFRPNADYLLDRVGVWLFDINAQSDPIVLSIREGGDNTPSRQILEQITFPSPQTRGFTPELVTIRSRTRPALRAGVFYWVVLEAPPASDSACSWAVASTGNGWSSVTDLFGSWQPGGDGAVPAHVIEGTRGTTRCPADLDDGSRTGAPDGGVTIDDLLYYLDLYTRGLSAADLDDGTGTGAPDGGVTTDDLLYFLDHYEAGC